MKHSDVLRLKIKNRIWFRMGLVVLLTAFVLCYQAYEHFGAHPIASTFFLFQGASSEEGNAGRALRELAEGDCVPPADPKPLAVLYALGVLYMFVGLAIIADDFFVPALDVISDKLGLSPDVAGATLLAAGGSAPELFTSAVGTFLRSDVGFGAIVGSAVFNVLFVVGICSLSTDKPMQLTWWPMCRDSSYYIVVLVLLAIFFGVITPQEIDWWEALVLHLMYYVYVYLMRHNVYVKKLVVKYLCRCKSKKSANDITTTLTDNLEDNNSEAAIENEDDDAEADPLFFHGSSKFRAGILNILLSNKPVSETVAIHMITKVNGTIEQKFNQIDTNGDGSLSLEEVSRVLVELGVPPSASQKQTVEVIFRQIDTDNNGQIDLQEFTNWYLASEERLRADMVRCFKAVDADGDGFIQKDEIMKVLRLLGDVEKEDDESSSRILQRLSTSGGANISLEDFKGWYEESLFRAQHLKRQESEQEAAEGLSLYPPEEKGLWPMFWYLTTLPLVFCFVFSLVDVRKSGNTKWAPYTFTICLVWMGILSYFMVSWVETIGATAGIPSVIMGLTFLAAGTSVPDMLSAVIVAKQGEGDKAVSSSIGSNVFDICIGLAFPWLLFYAVYQETVYVTADQLFISILTIVAAMFLMMGSLWMRNWLLPRSTGYFFIFLYCCFIGEQLGLVKEWGAC